MPDLPPKTLSQAHHDRVVASFPGATLAQKAASYDAWLTNHLIDHVLAFEMNKAQEQFAQQQQVRAQEIIASMPPRAQYPPGPRPAGP